MALSMREVQSAHHFTNKLWHMSQYVLRTVDEKCANLTKDKRIFAGDTLMNFEKLDFDQLKYPEKAFISRIHKLIDRCTKFLKSYQLAVPGRCEFIPSVDGV